MLQSIIEAEKPAHTGYRLEMEALELDQALEAER
jgi:hypothetical protein